MRPRINVDELLSGRQRGFLVSSFRFWLACAEPVYRLGVFVRNRSYDWGLFKSHSIDAPVISVGNITTGGTGKTPVVQWVVEQLLKKKKQPVIVSRGYGSLSANGQNENDEFLELQQALPGVVHLQNPDRVAAASKAVNSHGADVVVIDDGFQHRRLRRDLDVVLVDATSPFGFGHLLPRGLLREPLRSLRRADLIMITRVNQVDADRVGALLEALATVADGIPIVQVAFTPKALVNCSGREMTHDELKQQAVVGFCGIGNPAAFRNRLIPMCGTLVAFETFPDHHAYTQVDLSGLQRLASSLNAEVLVCTMKDLVKIRRLQNTPDTLFAVSQHTKVVSGGQCIEAALNRLCDPPK